MSEIAEPDFSAFPPPPDLPGPDSLQPAPPDAPDYEPIPPDSDDPGVSAEGQTP